MGANADQLTIISAQLQCKHQLAAQAAEALNQCEVVEVPDEVLSEILISS